MQNKIKQIISFLDKIELVAHSDYIPTVDDILHSRKMTTGIHQISFSVKIPTSMGGGAQEFRMFDVVNFMKLFLIILFNFVLNRVDNATKETNGCKYSKE